MSGRVHSYETMGALDGPGLRLVVFLQGCPLRCRYCHNPDTWATAVGQETRVDEIMRRIQRLRPYFGRRGGLTLSGGEPLQQPEFCRDILLAC
ncbi:MAG TPA: 4Fe-4S cluster-binding domain-containing protein, partial [Lentisphaeria bacterium]|nr:4Fe-4S cluster-binding domain-containing protein [Lentisphaeria bacterium]